MNDSKSARPGTDDTATPTPVQARGLLLPMIATVLVVAFSATAIIAAEGPEQRDRTGASETVPMAAAKNDAWLDALKGKHRQLFDATAPGGGVPLVHVMNYYDTYNRAYGVADRQVNAILTFYGGTTFYGLSDVMWAKYALGEFSDTRDPQSGTPATRNPWRTAPQVAGMSMPQASIESLQKRGATFIICENAIDFFANLVAKSRGMQASVVAADFKANILPNVTLVPGMVVAIEKAQGRGISYHKQ